MSRFGQLSYGQREKQFIGQPVEDIAATSAALLDRYHSNRDLIDELQIMESNINLIDNENDKAILRQQTDFTNQQLKAVSESGAYENAHNTVRSIYKNFQTNKGLQIAMSSKQQQAEVFEQIDSMEGLSNKYKGLAKEMSMYNYQGTRQDSDTGEWVGGFSGYIPSEPVDTTKLSDDILDGINYNKTKKGGWDLASAEANAAVQLYIQKHNESIETIDESRVGHIVKEYLLSNPEAMGWEESKAEMDYFNDFVKTGRTPTINNINSRFYSNFEYRQRLNSAIPKRGETNERGEPNSIFSDRVRKEYLDEIDVLTSTMIKNIISDFEEQGVEYNMEDIMEHVYKKSLIQEGIQTQMDILSSKYGFTRIDVSTDIKLNEYSRRLYDEQADYHAQILAGPDIPMNVKVVMQDKRELENNIVSVERQLGQLRYNLSTATDPNDIENYEIEISQTENHLKNLQTRKNDFDKYLDTTLKDVKTKDIFSNEMSNVLSNRHKAGLIDENDIRYIRESIIEGKNIDDVIDYLGESSKLGRTGMGWKGIFLNPDMSVKNMDDYIRDIGDVGFILEQRLLDLVGVYDDTKSEEVLQRLNTAIFRNLYNDSVNKFTRVLDDVEPAKHRGTFSIFTAGHPGLEANEQFLIKGIKDGNINLKDLTTGTTFQLDETREIIDNADEISISFGGVVDQEYNHPVFHVTARYKDEENKHYITSIDDLDNNLLQVYIEGLRDIKHATRSNVTRHTLHNYIGMMEGHLVPVDTYGNIGSAIDQKNIHNMKSGQTDTISTNIGNLFIKKHVDGTYTVKLGREGQESINLAGKGNYFQNIEDMYAPFGRLYNNILNRTR